MLVLSRKHDESIVIGDSITVMVVEIRHDKVRLGVVAPKEIPVHRQEVADKLKAGAIPKREADRNANLLVMLRGLVGEIDDLMAESQGVCGLHLNGDHAPWSEIEQGGRFERLHHLAAARALLAKGGA